MPDLQVLNISHNFLTRLEGPSKIFLSTWITLTLVTIKFKGRYLFFAEFLNIWISQETNLALLFHEILISGRIPSCVMKMSLNFEVFNLKNNNLSGSIPHTFPPYCALWTINLHRNLLDGPIPKSIVNWSKLEVLDLGSNQIIGGFPCSLKEMSQLRIIVLRKNKFQGSLRCLKAHNATWEMLQILDIAFNNFSGKLPGSFLTTWKKYMAHKSI
ncbi:hypothetical protein Fmac_012163 [Flemingia macrophylla]|uniref:Uncharacterized protein n=1 Tax=Flemingia macrophylla TaxID=520843 RepID=A0ABD1MPH8_9FABA